jgi:hypothetical protein
MTASKGAIQPYTWSELGYRRLGNQAQAKANGRSMLDILHTVAEYNVQQPEWIRHVGRKNEAQARSFAIAKCCDKSVLGADDSLAFVDEYFDWAHRRLPSDVPTLVASFEDRRDLVYRGRHDDAWKLMKYLGNAIGLSNDSSDLKAILRTSVLPAFFERYPKGHLLVLRHRFAYQAMAAGLRGLYAAAQVPPQDWISVGVGPCETLQHWHSLETDDLGLLLFELSNYLWYPFVTGFFTGQAGLRFLFLLDPAEQYKPPPFPADWLAIPQHSAAYGEQDRDLYAALAGGFDHPEHRQMAHRRFLNQSCPDPADRLTFIKWLIETANSFVYNVSDAANFTSNGDPDGEIDPVLGFEHLLTVERIMRRTLATVALREVGSAKSAVFEIADLFGALGVRFGIAANDAVFFKKLFNPTVALQLLEPRLKQIPVVGQGLFETATAVYKELEKTVLNSVWIRSKVGTNGVSVRDATLQGEVLEPNGEFVANVMRAYRNAHHGYFTEADSKQKRPSRYLWMVDGNVPDSITSLPVLWLFAYLADTTFVGWEPLPIGAFE